MMSQKKEKKKKVCEALRRCAHTVTVREVCMPDLKKWLLSEQFGF